MQALEPRARRENWIQKTLNTTKERMVLTKQERLVRREEWYGSINDIERLMLCFRNVL